MKHTALALSLLLASASAQTLRQFAERTGMNLPKTVGTIGAIAPGDVDGDGDLDVFIGYAGEPKRTNKLYLNDGRGGLREAPAVQFPREVFETYGIVFEDLDGDGDRDVLMVRGSYFTTSFRFYEQTSRGTFRRSTTQRFPTIGGSFGVSAGDVDRDGDVDLLLGGILFTSPTLLINDGKGRFNLGGQTPKPLTSMACQLVDLDGDGKLDIIVEGMFATSYLYVQTRSLVWVDETQKRWASLASRQGPVRAVDVDSDGDVDLIAQGAGTRPALLVNDGKGVFRDGGPTRLPANTGLAWTFVPSDIDLDGDLDLLVPTHHYVPHPLKLWLNDGRGTFTDETRRLPKTYARLLAMGDFDLDGDPDICAAHYITASGPAAIFVNHERQLHAPLPPRLGATWFLHDYLRPGYATQAAVFAHYLSLRELKPRVRLDPFGLLGIPLQASVALPPILVHHVATLSVSIPSATWLRGQRLFVQGIVLPSVSLVDARLTNLWFDTIR